MKNPEIRKSPEIPEPKTPVFHPRRIISLAGIITLPLQSVAEGAAAVVAAAAAAAADDELPHIEQVCA